METAVKIESSRTCDHIETFEDITISIYPYRAVKQANDSHRNLVSPSVSLTEIPLPIFGFFFSLPLTSLL